MKEFERTTQAFKKQKWAENAMCITQALSNKDVLATPGPGHTSRISGPQLSTVSSCRFTKPLGAMTSRERIRIAWVRKPKRKKKINLL